MIITILHRYINLIFIYINIFSIQDAKDRELLLGKADIIKKLLQYIGNWREKRSSKSSVIFTLKVLRHIVIRGTPPPGKIS